jgi:hypothetical protein
MASTDNDNTPGSLFARCGQALCGDGPRWKEQFADLLDIRTDTVDAMAKGKSRIPPGVWKDLREVMRLRALAFADLGQETVREYDAAVQQDMAKAKGPIS